MTLRQGQEDSSDYFAGNAKDYYAALLVGGCGVLRLGDSDGGLAEA